MSLYSSLDNESFWFHLSFISCNMSSVIQGRLVCFVFLRIISFDVSFITTLSGLHLTGGYIAYMGIQYLLIFLQWLVWIYRFDNSSSLVSWDCKSHLLTGGFLWLFSISFSFWSRPVFFFIFTALCNLSYFWVQCTCDISDCKAQSLLGFVYYFLGNVHICLADSFWSDHILVMYSFVFHRTHYFLGNVHMRLADSFCSDHILVMYRLCFPQNSISFFLLSRTI